MAEDFACHRFQGLAVLALGVDFGELDLDGGAVGIVARGFLEDFLRLQVTAVGQVDIRLRDGIHVTAGIQLTGRIGQRGTGGHLAVGRVYALAAALAEEGVGLQLAFHEAAVHAPSRLAAALQDAVATIAQQQGQDAPACQWNQRVAEQAVDEAGLRCGLRRRRGLRFGCWWRRRSLGGRRSLRRRCVGSGRGNRDGGGGGRLLHRRCRGLRCRGYRGGRRSGRHRDAGGRCCRGCGRRGRRAGSRRCGADLVQFGNIARQLGHARGVLAGLLVLRQLFVGTLGALDSPLGQGQLVRRGLCGSLVLDLGLHLAAGTAALRRHFGRGGRCSQLAAEFVEIAALGSHDLTRLRGGHGLGGGCIGHVQHHA